MIAASQGSPGTLPFTNTAGTVLYLFAIIDGGNPGATATYGGVSMTLLGQVAVVTGASDGYVLIFRLINPATGSNNMVINWTTGTQLIMVGLISFTGNVVPPDRGVVSTATYGGVNGTTLSNTVSPTTSGVGNIVISGGCAGSSAFTAVSGTLSSFHQFDNLGFCHNGVLQYTASGAGSTTLTVTNSTATSWATIGVEVLGTPAADQVMSAMNWPTNTPLFQPLGLLVYFVRSWIRRRRRRACLIDA